MGNPQCNCTERKGYHHRVKKIEKFNGYTTSPPVLGWAGELSLISLVKRLFSVALKLRLVAAYLSAEGTNNADTNNNHRFPFNVEFPPVCPIKGRNKYSRTTCGTSSLRSAKEQGGGGGREILRLQKCTETSFEGGTDRIESGLRRTRVGSLAPLLPLSLPSSQTAVRPDRYGISIIIIIIIIMNLFLLFQVCAHTDANSCQARLQASGWLGGLFSYVQPTQPVRLECVATRFMLHFTNMT
eukprot:gene9751-6839_t